MPEYDREDQDDVVITPKVEPTPDEKPVEEEAVRTYLKDRYGIEDDPETFRQRQAAYREAADQIPRYQQALETAKRFIMERQPHGQPPVGGPVAAEEEDEELLRAQARLDPYTVIKRLRAQDLAKMERMADEKARIAQASAVGNVAYMSQQREAGARLRYEYPEAWDPTSELHQEGLHIYRQEMSEYERRLPHAPLIAAERAAGRVGLAPVSRRGRSTADVAEEVEGQSVSRRGTRTRETAEDDKAKLNDNDRRMVEIMELDADVLAKAKAARRAKKNMRG